MNPGRTYKLGIDVGGTFTDGVLIDTISGEVVNVKVPSTPKDPSIGFLKNLDEIIAKSELNPEEIWFLVHGTTVATNSIIEGKTAKAALITTEGFRDILEIAFQIRPNLYDVFAEKPQPLIPRNLCFEVTERISAAGEVLTSLCLDSLKKLVPLLETSGVESVAVCLLHSYINDSHEKVIRDYLNATLPGTFVTLSSEICPEYREYVRASTTAINTAIIPVVSRYVEKIEQGLAGRGLVCDCYLMQSSGGVMSSQATKEQPCRIIESGPAAGVIAAAYIAGRKGVQDTLCIDIGGTTAKVGLILDGRPKISPELEVGAAAFSRSTARRASGYPLRTPAVDLVEIGAGGGSIAWVDSGGVLRVGPESAGADPGPACYPNGGHRPTLTDANLILGRLNPDFFLGGAIRLSRDRALKALRDHCSTAVHRDEIDTAAAIVEVAVSNMVNAIRFISVERGYDPRELALVTTGGAGPLHSNLIAAELDIPTVIVPPSPGLASALGLLVTDIRQERSRSVLTIRDLDSGTMTSIYRELAADVLEQLRRQGVQEQEISIYPSADIRYSGQSYELNVVFEPRDLDQLERTALDRLFHKEHERAYGFAVAEEPTTIVNLRVIGVANVPKPGLPPWPAGTSEPSTDAVKEQRQVYFRKYGELTKCPVFDRNRLKSGNRIAGPAIAEEVDSTTVILPDYSAEVDEFGNLVIQKT